MSAQQRDLLAIASHELRTPLSAIASWVRLLRSKQLDDAKAEHAFEVIEQNIKIQEALIEDILDAARLLNGNVRLQMQEVDLLTAVMSTVDVLRPQSEEKGIRLLIASSPAIPAIVADPLQLHRALSNLLSNAIKFTGPGGRILVEVSGNDSRAEINIIDTGEGIEPEFLPFVFKRFFQGGSVPGRNGGLGLGLAIVREIIELHSGSVNAYSEGKGKGATFTIRLPFQRKSSAFRA